ncbi:MAG: hypothetical protein SFZ02_21055 [bacterium]|nr:hypothetical protein [bacterium]
MQKRFSMKLFILSMMLMVWLAMSTMTVSGAGELVVLPSNYQGWDFATDSTIPVTFADGPSTPPLGTGSLTTTIAGAGQRIRFTQAYGTFDVGLNLTGGLDATTFTLSYSTYTDPSATNTNNWYANIYLLLDSSLPADHVFAGPVPNCFRADFTPADNPATGTWNNYALSGASTIQLRGGCFGSPTVPSTWSALLAFPQVNNPRITGIAINMGDSASSYVGYSGAFDNLYVNGIGYDFELNPPVVVVPPVTGTVVTSSPVIGCVLAPPSGLDITNAPDNTYCTSLMKDGAVVAYSGAVPANLIQAGVIRAIDIFRLEGGRSIATFPNYVQVCLAGVGRFVYMDATQAPRVAVEMPSTITADNAYTCAWIPNPGTVILINE